MSEQAFLLGKTKSLVGIVTGPSGHGHPNGRPTIILLNAGLVHRVGPHRLYVKIARRLAAAGFLVLRFDLSGIGDSRGRNDDLSFEEGIISDVKEAMDFLAAHRGAERFILMGICSGANNALRVAHRDERVVGIVPIEGYYFSSHGYHLYAYGKRLFSPKSWRRLITMKSDLWNVFRRKNTIRRAIAPQVRSQPGQSGLGWRRSLKTQMLAEVRQLVARGIHLSFIYCVDSPSYYNHYLKLKRELGPLTSSGRLQVRLFDQSDHTFTLLSNQQLLVDAIHDWAQGVAQAMPPDRGEEKTPGSSPRIHAE